MGSIASIQPGVSRLKALPLLSQRLTCGRKSRFSLRPHSSNLKEPLPPHVPSAETMLRFKFRSQGVLLCEIFFLRLLSPISASSHHMEQPIASIEHLKAIEGHPEARPLDLNPSPSTSTSQSLSPANASPRPTLPSSPSALSISRPPPLTRPSAVPVSTFTAASTRNPSPSPQGQTTPQPVLLNSLTASDGESILCIAVEEDDQDVEGARGRKEREREQGGVKTGGKVYGGSQGGDIHVSRDLSSGRSWFGANSCCRIVPFSTSFRTFC